MTLFLVEHEHWAVFISTSGPCEEYAMPTESGVDINAPVRGRIVCYRVEQKTYIENQENYGIIFLSG